MAGKMSMKLIYTVFMKRLLKLFMVVCCVAVMVGCTSKGKSSDHASEWLGTYTDGDMSLILNPQGVCRVVTAGGSVGAEYVWDVDGGAVLVTDETGRLYLFRAEGAELVSSEGKRLAKRK